MIKRLYTPYPKPWPKAVLVLGLLLLSTAAWAGPIQQMQLARRFLLAVLDGRFQEAYQQLAPEIRSTTTPEQFRVSAQPLYQKGQELGPAIELYRLGLRLGENDDSRWFYAFTFKSDSANVAPLQLDITFRDSTAVRVLEYRVVKGKVR